MQNSGPDGCIRYHLLSRSSTIIVILLEYKGLKCLPVMYLQEDESQFSPSTVISNRVMVTSQILGLMVA